MQICKYIHHQVCKSFIFLSMANLNFFMNWSFGVLLLVCCVACKKESQKYPIDATGKKSSGTSFSIQFENEEVKIHYDSVQGYKELYISGLKKKGEYNLILIVTWPRVGEFKLGPGTGNHCGFMMPYLAACCSYSSSLLEGFSGSITIEALTDTTVKGSFNAHCISVYDTLDIKNGRFDGRIEK